MSYIDYLDMHDLFVNEISGSMLVFVALALVIILFFCAKFRFPNIVTIALMVVFLLFMSPFMPTLLVLVLIFVGGMFSLGINKLIQNR